MSESSHTGSVDFKDIVHEWIELHDEMKRMQSLIREKRNRQNQLQHHIVLFMKENEKEICNVGNSSALVIKSRKSASGIKKSDVMKVLQRHMSEERAKAETQALYNERPTQLKEYVQLVNQI